jgi:hypothetical protein
MKQWLAVGVVIAAVVSGTAVSPDAQQSNPRAVAGGTATAKPYVPPRTPWGDPDIQGGWTNVNENGIPMEKPNALGEKSLDDIEDAELADLVRERNERAAASAAGIGGRETGAGPTHWYEHYNAKNSRAWMVSDPPDGRIPPLTPEAQKRQAGGRGRFGGGGAAEGGRADSWLDRSLYDRCITRGFPGSMSPAIYGNAYDITQAPGLVAIRYEMIHEARIIPLDNSARPNLEPYMGVARGRWEGDTLVVETVGIKETVPGYNNIPHSSQMRITERIRLVTPDVLHDQITIEDPVVLAKPVTYTLAYRRLPDYKMVEFICENNREYVDEQGRVRMRLGGSSK